MIKIAVCEDEPSELDGILSEVRRFAESRGHRIHPAAFRCAQDLIDNVESRGGYDLYLLDIIMPGIDGIGCGRRLRDLGSAGEIVYLTTSGDYAVDSYDVRAYHCLVKPVASERLWTVLDGAIERLSHRPDSAIVVATPTGSRRLMLSQVLYAERAGSRVRYRLTDATVESLTIRVPFHEAACELLHDARFCAAGASFAVNLERVSGISGQEVSFDTGETLRLPRDASVPFKAAWGRFWLGGGA